MVGTTAVVGVVANGTLIVANVGDSEAIAISVVYGLLSFHCSFLLRFCPFFFLFSFAHSFSDNKPVAIEMTTPHKATDAIEKARIEALGGHVFLGRVFGSLAVTRAFGDSKFKTPKMSQDFVSVEPAFHELVLTPAHKYVGSFP